MAPHTSVIGSVQLSSATLLVVCLIRSPNKGPPQKFWAADLEGPHPAPHRVTLCFALIFDTR